MAMIDIGLKIEIATKSGDTVPVSGGWTELKDCVAVPALIQPSAKIATDFIGDDFIGELMGKKTITALDFTFAFDGTESTSQYKILSDIDKSGEQHYIRVTYPEGTKFEMLAEVEVSLVAVTPSTEIDYTLSVVPVRTNKFGGETAEIIHMVENGGSDPLAGA